MPVSRDSSPLLAERYPLRILVAEDNGINRRVITTMLARLGYAAEVAVDGEEAYHAVRGGRFDVVLMDLHMPVQDGFETARQIRGDESIDPQPAIVAVTATVSQDSRASARASGMDDFLEKPVATPVLADTLRACAERRADGVPVARAAPTPTIEVDALERLRMLYGGDPARFRSLIESHIGNVQVLLGGLREALSSGDRPAAERAAHSLKSTAAMFGSAKASAQAGAIEALVVAGEMDEARDRVSVLAETVARAERRLRQHLEADPGS